MFRQRLKDILQKITGPRGYRFAYSVTWAFRMRWGKEVEEEQRFLPLFVCPGDVCVDIGAHAGAYTYRLARLVGPTGFVHAFEGSPFYADVLNRALQMNRVSNVTVYAIAVADKCGTRGYVETDETGSFLHGCSHLAATGELSTVTVPVTTLDLIGREQRFFFNTRFVKCDVEGADLAVLRGALGILTASRPVVQCEVNGHHLGHYGDTVDEIFSLMKEINYIAFDIGLNGELRLITDINNRRENVLFIPRERPANLPLLIRNQMPDI